MKVLLFIIAMMLSNFVFAHMCHDPFRPKEHLVLVLDKDLIKIEEKGEFRMYIENTFSSTLQEVRLFVKSQAFDIKIEPSLLKKLVPGERTFFLVKLKLREGLEPGDYPLRISVDARSAELKPGIEKMDVVVDKKIPESIAEPIPQIKPEEIKREEIVPAEEKFVPPEVPVREVRPLEREEIMPAEEKVVLPQKKSEPPVEEVEPSEKVVEPLKEEISRPLEASRTQEVGEVVVKVEKLPFWQKPYFYIILILCLFAILLWRKTR